MTQRTAFAISAGITAFILVLAGALFTYFSQPGTVSQAEPTATAALAQDAQVTAPDSGADVQAIIDQREATYRQQLDQAKRQLEQANAQLQQAHSQLQLQLQAQAPTAIPAPQEPATQAGAVSPAPPPSANVSIPSTHSSSDEQGDRHEESESEGD